MDDNNEEETSKKTSSKNESNKTKEISSTSSSVFLGKQKLTKAEKRFKKYKRAIKLIKNMNTKINCIFLKTLDNPMSFFVPFFKFSHGKTQYFVVFPPPCSTAEKH